MGLDNVENNGPKVYEAINSQLIISDEFGGRTMQRFDDYVTGIKDGEVRYVAPTASVGCAGVLVLGLLARKVVNRNKKEEMVGGMSRRSFDERVAAKEGGGKIFNGRTGQMDML